MAIFNSYDLAKKNSRNGTAQGELWDNPPIWKNCQEYLEESPCTLAPSHGFEASFSPWLQPFASNSVPHFAKYPKLPKWVGEPTKMEPTSMGKDDSL